MAANEHLRPAFRKLPKPVLYGILIICLPIHLTAGMLEGVKWWIEEWRSL
jgi:hypothetical protein